VEQLGITDYRTEMSPQVGEDCFFRIAMIVVSQG
jgi:hypothetical protein